MDASRVDLRADMNELVSEVLAGAPPQIPQDSKVIHDRVWGTHRFLPHEIALLDSPVVQRLWRIRQTGFSFFTYPSTTHTRFEHSLGSAIVVRKMLDALDHRRPKQIDMDPLTGDLAQLRVAALLHDCGHGFGSHVSEAMYKWHPEMQRAKSDSEKFKDARESELLSWHIVTSDPFRSFLEEINARCGCALNADRIADLILGIPYDERSFLPEVLNGPFDVDRIDYILRDAEYAGLESGVDVDRLLYDVDISFLQDGKQHLVLRSTHTIEQLLWTKLHLFVQLYRHQKVLAADGTVQTLVPLAQESGRTFRGADFRRVSDFLRVTDFDILGADPNSEASEFRPLLRDLRNRRLPHRCLRVTPAAIKSAGAPVSVIRELQRLQELPEEIDRLRREIWEQLPADSRPSLHSIIFSFPPAPSLREATQVYVMWRGRSEPVTLSSLFRIDEWLSTYNEAHWAGFVFAERGCGDAVAEAALGALRARGIELEAAVARAMRKPVTVSGPLLAKPLQQDLMPITSPRLPVLATFTQRQATSTAPLPLRGLKCLLILHFLSDLPPLLDRFVSLGLDPANTWVVRKYAYRRADEITAYLRRSGYHVETCELTEEAEAPAHRALTQLVTALSESDRFVVVEDGGYITPLLHTPEFIGPAARCIGVVEQTTKGIRAVRAVENAAGLRCPVVAVAESRLKLGLEASEVGDALAYSLESYFRHVVGTTLNRVPILVIGFGAVGRNLAHGLRNRGAQVSIFDSNWQRHVEAQSEKPTGFLVVESFEEINSFCLIVGTTGTTSLSAADLLRCADGVLLASGSSDRLEFDLAGLLQHVVPPYEESIDSDGLVTRYRVSGGKTIGVLCDGYPINFILGDGVAKSVIDPILTELLAGAVLLATGEIQGPGIHQIPETLEKELWELYSNLRGY